MRLSEDYKGCRCEVKTMKNQLLAVGVVTDLGEDMVTVGPRRGSADSMPILKYNTRAKVVIYRPGQDSYVLAGVIYISNRDFIRVTQIENLTDFEKRKFFRLNVSMRTVINYRLSENERLQSCPVEVRDISLSGIAFRSSQEFEVGQRMEILLHLLDAQQYYFQCKVVRIVPQEDEGPPVYGCIFEGVADNMSSALCAYLFQQQRMEIRKKRFGS